MTPIRSPVWCVEARDGMWCAVKGNRKPEEGAFSVATRCGMHITLPWGIERTIPTCPACREGHPELAKETPDAALEAATKLAVLVRNARRKMQQG
jgi:hypothetical protein